MKTLKFTTGNLLLDKTVQVIGHQANCQNTFGSGIAKTIREIYPEAYAADTQAAKEKVNILGNISLASVPLRNNTKIEAIFNLYGQNLFGREFRKTNYEALYSSLEKMNNLLSKDAANFSVGFPYKMGSDRGGGNWDIVQRLIEVAFAEYKGDVIIVKYE